MERDSFGILYTGYLLSKVNIKRERERKRKGEEERERKESEKERQRKRVKWNKKIRQKRQEKVWQ